MKILHNYSLPDSTLQEYISKEDKLIKVKDIREYFNGCVPGWRNFVKFHNLNWREHATLGIKASLLIQTQDAMAINLVKYVYLRDLGQLEQV